MIIERVKERIIDGLIEEARQPALLLIACAADQGVSLRVTFGYRPFAQQAALYAQGRGHPLEEVNALRVAAGLAPITATENAFRVTKAQPGRSWHQWRRAIDVVPVDAATSPDLSDPDNPIWNAPWWLAIGQLGEALGFEWGGRWPDGVTDKPHFQWTRGATLADLLAEHPHGLDA
jgi:peptidoglycan L-alanyl-D-glutamate endopeptidase CwlK